MMKALSVRQPWAWLIIFAGKDIENRDWSTTQRGRVLVHAAKGMTLAEYRNGIDTLGEAKMAGYAAGVTLPMPEDLERGGIVGSVDIVDCVRSSTSPWFFGENGFVLRNPQPLPFRPLRGMLGFFGVPDA